MENIGSPPRKWACLTKLSGISKLFVKRTKCLSPTFGTSLSNGQIDRNKSDAKNFPGNVQYRFYADPFFLLSVTFFIKLDKEKISNSIK